MRRLAVLLLTVLALTACDGPTAGELSIDLVTPNGNDGAILFKIQTRGARELGDVTAECPECQAFPFRVTDSELYCAVTGSLQTGPLVTIVVSDIGARSVYAVEILEVAGLDHRLRSDVGYELKLAH